MIKCISYVYTIGMSYCSRVCFEMYLVVTKHPPFKLAISSLVAEEEATFDSDGTTGSASTKFQ